jgi:hypothetical protein
MTKNGLIYPLETRKSHIFFKKNFKKTVMILLILAALIHLVPFFAALLLAPKIKTN